MRVNEDGGDEEAVQDGVERASGEGSNGQRDQTDRDEALEAPVVATVGVGWVGDSSSIVDCLVVLVRTDNGVGSRHAPVPLMTWGKGGRMARVGEAWKERRAMGVRWASNWRDSRAGRNEVAIVYV